MENNTIRKTTTMRFETKHKRQNYIKKKKRDVARYDH